MNIVRLVGGELAYGEQKLFSDASFVLQAGEKVALIGRNGIGKSTLLKLLQGDIALDDGDLWIQQGLRIAALHQSVPEMPDQTVFDVVKSGILAEYEKASEDEDTDWSVDHKVDRIVDMLGLPAQQLMSECSGGMQRRAMLGQTLVADADLLLLDEPTNHLEIAAIDKLQDLLVSTTTTLVMVSHDRALVDKVASRIVELDRGTLTSFPGNYQAYLQRKQHDLEVEATANRKFDRNLAQEESWIRQGIKARRTRNEGRVRRLQSLRKERAARVSKQGKVQLSVDGGQQSGNIVAKLEDVSFAYPTPDDTAPLISNFSTLISRGDRVGIIGANGCGKSTLIRLILGELQPASGQVTLGTKLHTAYFDQQRTLLDENTTVRENVSPGSDFVEVGGRRKHVVGYLADFLFPSSYMNMPMAKLSGGEKNRLLMAKLLAHPANLLVLDEPTNDLDVETLELFEELLGEFEGTTEHF